MPKHQPRPTVPDYLVGDGGSEAIIQGTAAMYLFEPNGDALPFLGDYEFNPAFPRCARCRVRCEPDFGILYKGIVGSSGVRHGQRGG